MRKWSIFASKQSVCFAVIKIECIWIKLVIG